MGFKASLNNLITTRGGGSKAAQPSQGKSSTFGRVEDIILDENHPQYSVQGGGLSINGVFYRPLNKAYKEVSVWDLPFAFQSTPHLKTVPIVGELVQVDALPNPIPNQTDDRPNVRYYTRVLNIWNNANSNVYPDIFNNPNIDITSNGKFKELSDINPLRSTPGDIQVEGRQGQSIRFTGGKGSGNPWVDNTNIGKPVIIISNGQSETDDGFTTLEENINDDSSSIYMVSDHQIGLTPANTKRDAYNQAPTPPDEFKGNQILMNGGRLFFNAKQEDIQFSSIKSIGMNTKGSVNIDASTYYCVDAPNIYLGAKARSAPGKTKEPVLLGNQTEQFLKDIVDELVNIARALSTNANQDPILTQEGSRLLKRLPQLLSEINPKGDSSLKSKKVFTE